MNANFVELGNVAQFINGAAFKPEDWCEDGLKIIRIQNLTDQTKPFNCTKRVVDKKLIVEKGDILVSWSATLGVFEWKRDESALLNQHIFRVIPNNNLIDKNYLRNVLSSALNDMNKHLHGATMKHVNRGEFLATKIPLPPLAEQKRIAAILDKANEIKAKRELALAKLDELAECIFTEMFGDFETNTKKFPVEVLSSLVTVQGGYAFKSNDYLSTGIRLVKISNVHKDNLIWDEDGFLPNEYLKKFSDYELRCNDIVVALTRPIIKSLNSVKVAVVNQSDLPCLLNQRVARFIFKNEAKLNQVFFRALLATKFFYNLVNKLCSTALQPNISTKQIESIGIPLPPLSEQQRFETIIKELGAIKLPMIKSCNLSTNNFLSLQNQAFTTGFNA